MLDDAEEVKSPSDAVVKLCLGRSIAGEVHLLGRVSVAVADPYGDGNLLSSTFKEFIGPSTLWALGRFFILMQRGAWKRHDIPEVLIAHPMIVPDVLCPA